MLLAIILLAQAGGDAAKAAEQGMSPAALAAIITGAATARQRVATFAVDGEVRFASAADRAAFAEELAGAVADLVARYHRPTAAGGRDHRVIVALHPAVKPETKEP